MSSSEPLNILLVEDDEVDVMAVKRAFAKAKIPHSITVAKDGVEALDLLHQGAVAVPVIILLDLNMPRMTGLEFLEELRGDAMLRNHIVFVLTTSKAEEDLVAAYSFNVAGYIVKEKVGEAFSDLVQMMERYWEMIEMPLGN